jgi:hypothetical protein
MDEIVWGAEIPVNGVCPTWLRTSDTVDLKTSEGWRYSKSGVAGDPRTYSWTQADGTPCILSIRLRPDHSYYTATTEGFTYWPGGNEAPEDWDGGEVLLRDGCLRSPHLRSSSSIIGYRKRAETTSIDDFTRHLSTQIAELDRLRKRETELIEANNALVERARKAERTLRAITDLITQAQP